MFRRRVLQLLAVSSMVLAACSPTPAPGLVMVAVSTNLVPGRDFTRAVLVAGDLTDGKVGFDERDFFPQEVDFPWTLAVRAARPDQDQKFPARVRVLLLRPLAEGSPEEVVVAARDVQFELPPPETQQMVHVSIDWLSMYDEKFFPVDAVTDQDDFNPFPVAGRNCSETTTLNALGECVGIGVDEQGEFDRKIEPYDPARIFGGGTSPTDGSACFVAKACLEGGQEANAALVNGACEVELPAEVSDTTSLAVLTSSNEPLDVARCGAAGCGDDFGAHGRGVVLDREAFTFSGRKVTLPKKVCERFPGGARILAHDVCAKKERSLPLCPDSEFQFGRVGATRPIRP